MILNEQPLINVEDKNVINSTTQISRYNIGGCCLQNHYEVCFHLVKIILYIKLTYNIQHIVSPNSLLEMKYLLLEFITNYGLLVDFHFLHFLSMSNFTDPDGFALYCFRVKKYNPHYE